MTLTKDVLVADPISVVSIDHTKVGRKLVELPRLEMSSARTARRNIMRMRLLAGHCRLKVTVWIWIIIADLLTDISAMAHL